MNNLAVLLKAWSWAFPSFRPKGATMGEVLRRAVDQNEAQDSTCPAAGGASSFLTIPRPTQLQARGRYEEAEPLYSQALEIRSGLRGLVA